MVRNKVRNFREGGNATFLFLTLVLPLLFMLFTISIDITGFYKQKQVAQQIVDDGARIGSRYLPNKIEAEKAAYKYLEAMSSDLTYSVEATDSLVNVRGEGRARVTFFHFITGLFLGGTPQDRVEHAEEKALNEDGLPFVVGAKAGLIPKDILLFLDNSKYLAPDPTRDKEPWDKEHWPVPLLFKENIELRFEDDVLPPALAVQQCYNPVLNEFKRAAIRFYEFTIPITDLHFGTMLGPGKVSTVVTRQEEGEPVEYSYFEALELGPIPIEVESSEQGTAQESELEVLETLGAFSYQLDEPTSVVREVLQHGYPSLYKGEGEFGYFRSEYARDEYCFALAEQATLEQRQFQPPRNSRGVQPIARRRFRRIIDDETHELDARDLRSVSIPDVLWTRAVQHGTVDISKIMKDAAGQLFAENGGQRGRYSQEVSAAAVLLLGDFPHEGSKRFPNGRVNSAIQSAVQEIDELAKTVNREITFFFIVAQHAGVYGAKRGDPDCRLVEFIENGQPRCARFFSEADQFDQLLNGLNASATNVNFVFMPVKTIYELKEQILTVIPVLDRMLVKLG